MKYKACFENAFHKFNELWCATNRPKASELIFSILEESLILPCKTRWNSITDAIEKVLKFPLRKLNVLMIELGLTPFTDGDHTFLNEYFRIFEPFTLAIDNLQASNCYYAILLPTLHGIKTDLEEFEKENWRFCQPLLKVVKKGFFERFGPYFDLNDPKCIPALVAACSHPFFKMRWLNKEFQNKEFMDSVQNFLVSAAIEMTVTMNSTSKKVESNTTGKLGHIVFILNTQNWILSLLRSEAKTPLPFL